MLFLQLRRCSWGGVPEDRIKVYEFNTNWNNTNQSSISIKTTLPTEPFYSFFSGGFSNITQPGNGTPLDAIQQVLMFRAQYIEVGRSQHNHADPRREFRF